MANDFTGTVENNLFNEDNENNPIFYCRYVYDVFCVFRINVMFNNFHGGLNNLNRSITFTYELGGDEASILVMLLK